MSEASHLAFIISLRHTLDTSLMFGLYSGASVKKERWSPGHHDEKEARKKEKQRLEREKKEQKEKEKKENEMKKKFKVSDSIAHVH